MNVDKLHLVAPFPGCGEPRRSREVLWDEANEGAIDMASFGSIASEKFTGFGTETLAEVVRFCKENPDCSALVRRLSITHNFDHSA